MAEYGLSDARYSVPHCYKILNLLLINTLGIANGKRLDKASWMRCLQKFDGHDLVALAAARRGYLNAIALGFAD